MIWHKAAGCPPGHPLSLSVTPMTANATQCNPMPTETCAVASVSYTCGWCAAAAVALVLCLNIGVDPPDVIKISPCARLECWVDPLSMQPAKALETIGELCLAAEKVPDICLTECTQLAM